MVMASLAAASASQAPAHVTATSTVICAKPYDDMCVALAGALERIGRQVEILSPVGGRRSGQPGTTFSFVEEGRSTEHIAGHLAWVGTDGVIGRGETLRCNVIDAPLNDTMLVGYADALVQHAKLPD